MIDIEFTPEATPDDSYEPMPEHVHDASALIFDPVEFADLTNSIAATMFEGQLLVLDRDSRQWINVAPPAKAKVARSFKSVP